MTTMAGPSVHAAAPSGAAPAAIDARTAEHLSIKEAFCRLAATPEGLSGNEAARRLAALGPNLLQEKTVSPLRRFLGYFWGPIPWMIEVAAVLSALLHHWTDFVIIAALLVFNASVGFWQEFKAANALAALKKQLALGARVLRDGRWGAVAARALVPGDVIRMRLGDIVPADAMLIDGDYLSIDQSALTGESLPVTKRRGAVAYSGSVAKQGEMSALVIATGADTYFGREVRPARSSLATDRRLYPNRPAAGVCRKFPRRLPLRYANTILSG